jgi:signal transduction histidine kinase
MEEQRAYFHPRHAERLIAAGRLILALFSLLAFVLIPTEAGSHSPQIRLLAVAYVAYAGGMALLVWIQRARAPGLTALTHVVDLLLCSIFMTLTDGPTGPFFIYFVFAIVSGAIRWQRRGALLSAAATLGAYAGVTLAGAAYVGSAFQWGSLLTRSAQLAAVAALLLYLVAYEQRLQTEIVRLASWPRRMSPDPEIAVRDCLRSAAGILRARRVVLAWHEEEEPSLHVASDGDRFELSEQPPDVFGRLVAEPLQRSSFLCTDVSASSCAVILRVPDGFTLWRGPPLSTTFRERYAIKSVLALRIVIDSVEGWLFAFDRAALSVDDLLVGDVVGRLVGAVLDQDTLLKQLREVAAGNERLRLARELHDGVLQALTGLALQAGRLRELMARDPAQAEPLLSALEEAVLTEQRGLRSLVEELNPGHAAEGIELDCPGRLRDVATRIATQWDVRVHLDLAQDAPPLPRRLAHEICRMAQESLVNAIRHGAAKDVRLKWGAGADQVNLMVAYAGRGFATFRGRHDLESLNRMKAGPRTLKERVSELRGALVINSDDEGATLAIAIPLTSGAASHVTRLP